MKVMGGSVRWKAARLQSPVIQTRILGVATKVSGRCDYLK